MALLTLTAGEQRTISVATKYLSVINANKAFRITAPELDVVGEIGRQYELDSINAITFENNNAEQITVEYELANIKIHQSGKGSVKVENEVTVSRIVEAIQVNANATVDNGKMSELAANNSNCTELTLAAGATIEIAAARAATQRSVTIQLITASANTTSCRIAQTAAQAAQGLVLRGNLDATATAEVKTQTELNAFNDSTETIKIVVFEQWRA